MYEHRDDIQPGGSMPPAERRPRNLKWGLVAAVVVTLIAAVPGILLDRDAGTDKVTTAQPTAATTTTTTGLQAGDTTPALPATTTTAKKGTVKAVALPTSLPATSTTVPAGCHNSYDARCGPFRWEPDPGPNAPLTVTVTPENQQGTAGQEVNFHVVANDPDAKIDRGCIVIEFGDDDTHPSCPTPSCQTPYGPWTPPAKAPDKVEVDIKHTYATARAEPYRATFRYRSSSFCSPDPYGGTASAIAQVQVNA
jgi:hypothetical protein